MSNSQRPHHLILASSSLWRRSLFRSFFHAHFQAHPESSFLVPDIDEKAIRDNDPKQMVQRIAEAKCLAVLDEQTAAVKGAIVMCLDQIVLCGGEVREKPANADEARRQLRTYQSASDDKPVECVNGIVVHDVCTGRQVSAVETSVVRFRPFSDQVLEEVIDSGMAFTTAGAFSITHENLGKYMTIEGTAQSVEGFPVDKIIQMLNEVTSSPSSFSLPSLCPRPIKCVLFDMDGLLLDTEKSYTLVQQKILSRYGAKFTLDVKKKIMGRKELDGARFLISEYGLEGRLDPHDFSNERDALLRDMFVRTELLPGVERLLLHLDACGVPMAVATSSHRANYELKTTLTRKLFDKVFRHVVTGDCVENSKPHPEIFQLAFKKFGFEEAVSPDEVLVFEDALLGVEAGVKAGMKVVMVSNWQEPEGETRPDQYLESMFHFRPDQWGLPAFK